MLYKHTKYKQVPIFSNLFAMHLLPQLEIIVMTISKLTLTVSVTSFIPMTLSIPLSRLSWPMAAVCNRIPCVSGTIHRIALLRFH